MTRFSVVFAISLVALSLSACTININVPSNPGFGMMNSERAEEDQVEMFAEMMIPHHQQAIDMSLIALERSDNEAVKDLAQRIIDGQTPEIELMSTWISGSGSRGMISGMGMPGMGGMASDEEKAELGTLTSPEFDRQFLTLMIEHHEGALRMVHMIDDSRVSEVAELADDIVRVQTEEIEEMNALLEGLNNA
jgi:uncharacterized protein (DUF305 family)